MVKKKKKKDASAQPHSAQWLAPALKKKKRWMNVCGDTLSTGEHFWERIRKKKRALVS
jgi:hypothetical protein